MTFAAIPEADLDACTTVDVPICPLLIPYLLGAIDQVNLDDLDNWEGTLADCIATMVAFENLLATLEQSNP